jgi:hypothetical protein
MQWKSCGVLLFVSGTFLSEDYMGWNRFCFAQQLTYYRFHFHRYKNLEPTLRDIAGSFRCYADGLQLSGDLVTV